VRAPDTQAPPGTAGSAGSKAASRRRPPFCRISTPSSVNEFLLGSCTQAPTQPSANANSTRPSSSMMTSLKSSRLRLEPQVVPDRQMPPAPCTGSFGDTLTVCQVWPPS
jgi:hypothetical protein